ncbi:MAG TPA: 16S rRNA (guanine(966)-N(2))-methyltransferase RsmD [Acidimicrobiales bacterium]|nr:16S rRNA (guanine(966)-N(2))-methyltransferase RsmD [Acidimicrobiales bacterium]
MRVVAGVAGGRRLATLPGGSVRPTSDRVREAVFNALISLDAVRGATAVDLFAGSGALGVEALSRGADHSTFVDHDAKALAVVRANLDATGLEADARVVRSDALRFLDEDAGHFDLALLDPPYRFDDRAWSELLAALDADIAVLESDRTIELGVHWDPVRLKRYGTTVVTIARHR